MPTAPGETGTMSTYQPTLRDRLAELLGKGAEATGMQPRTAAAYGRQATGLADLLPGIGSGLAASEIAPAVKRGDYGAAALNTLGAVPDVGPLGKAMFVGLASRLADKEALTTAKKMLTEGASREDVLKTTGWFQQHGDWKYEIPDDQMTLGTSAFRRMRDEGTQTAPLAGTFWHDQLYKNYPELRSVEATTEFTPEKTGGRWTSGLSTDTGKPTLHARAPTELELGDVALHEMQHGVQEAENFPWGGSPSEFARGPMFDPRASDLKDELSKSIFGGHLPAHEVLDNAKYGDPAALEAIARKHGFGSTDEALAFLRKQDEMRTPASQYKRLAGEVEARNTSRRQFMSTERRRAVPPWQTQDVPDNEQIVRRLSDITGRKPEAAMSAPLDRLPGAPPHVEGPVPEVAKAAEDYASKRGFKLDRQKRYAEANPRRGRYIAQAYDKMQHAPADPKVAASYKALADETMGQWQQLQDAGAKIEFIKPGMPDPYPGGPREALADLRANHHLWVFPSEQGFGTVNKIADNPLLASTGIQHGGHDMTVNDAFRAVHDYFGHGMEGANFGARGEENAWQAHKRLFSDEALPALTSETRGQNSWVNFGPFGERNQANRRDTVFADQKTGLLPRWAMKEGGMPLSYRALQAGTGGALLAALALRGSTPRRPDE